MTEGADILSRADEIFAAMCRDIIDNGFSSEGQLIRAKWEDGSLLIRSRSSVW